MKASKLFILMFVLLTTTSLLQAQGVEELISKSDAAYKVYDYEKALTFLKEAEKESQDNWDITWRISRAIVDKAQNIPINNDDDEDLQLSMYENAKEYATKAITLDSTKSIGYIRRAITNGRIALFKGVFSVGGIVNEVKDDAEKAITLNNGGDYQQSIAHYVLGRTHAKISEKWAPARAVLGLGWADIEIAIVEFDKAIKLRQNFIMYYLDYSKALIEEDEYELAKEMLKKAMDSPLQDKKDKERLVEVKSLFEEIKDE